MSQPPRSARTISTVRNISIAVGLVLLGMAVWSPNFTQWPDPAFRVALVGLTMALWWILEALPLAVTSLIPLTLFPIAGIQKAEEAAAPYAHPLIYLFLGGFFIALAIERWSLHRRLAFWILLRVGQRCDQIVGGFLLVTAFISMWVNNTATAMMMLPIGLSVIEVFKSQSTIPTKEHRHFAVALMLSIAYGASLGGIGTLIGSTPNMLFSAYMEEAGFQKIDFMAWAKFGLPILALSLPLTWLYLSRWLFPMGHMQLEGGREYLQTELQKLGPMSRGEKLTALVFILAALGWALSPLFEKMFPGFEIEDSTIAIAATISFFIIPVSLPRREFLLDWEWSAKIPWEVLVQFGGGLSLAAAVSSSGLAKEIGHSLQGLAGAPLLVMIGAIVVTIIALSEVASNTATAATLLPIIGSLAVALEYDPLLLTAPAAIAASCGFMLPIATPPNAIVFAGHHLEVSEMVKAGFILDIIAAVLVTVVPYFIIQWF